jgi:hypothetical protein
MTDDTTKTVSYWLPLVTAFGGLISGLILEWLRDKRSYTREQTARNAARRDAQIERRNDFQRRTLLHLQDAVQASIRNTSQMHHWDTMSKREGEAWHSRPYPDDLNEKVLLAN